MTDARPRHRRSPADHHARGAQAPRPRPTGRARGDRGVPAARDPGADRRQLAGLALDRRHRRRTSAPRSPSSTARSGTRTSRRAARPAPTPTRSSSGCIDSASYLAEHLHEVPVHVIPCIYGATSGAAELVDAAGVFGSILPAVWSFQLALRSRGLGSAFTTLHLPHARRGRRAARHPRRRASRPRSIPVAYFTGDDFKPAKRRPVEEITYWNGWKQPDAADAGSRRATLRAAVVAERDRACPPTARRTSTRIASGVACEFASARRPSRESAR